MYNKEGNNRYLKNLSSMTMTIDNEEDHDILMFDNPLERDPQQISFEETFENL
jgi:hypothetical protein